MNKEQKLEELRQKGVKFLPWIGDKYDEGIYYDKDGILCYGNGQGKKVMVLGESFYWGEDEFSGEVDDKASMFVYDLIKQVISENPEFNTRTFTRFENAIAYENDDRDWDSVGRKNFWNHLIFYDYVQEPLIYPRSSPTEKEFKNSEEAFWNVLEILQPDIIIAWGMRLYNHLPRKGKRGKTIEGEDYILETWIYKERIRVIPIVHPAAPMFSTKRWYDIIKKI